jgi:hypothetical protein
VAVGESADRVSLGHPWRLLAAATY